MRIAGEAVLHAPVVRVWDALLDPAVLVRTIPGCERLEAIGDHSYAMTVTTGVAAVRGTYTGTCELHDLVEHRSLVLSARGAGAQGTIAADVNVVFEDHGDGTTAVRYDSDTTIGGMIGGVGQRLLGSVGRRLAAEFLHAVDDVLTGAVAQPAAAAAPVAPGVPVTPTTAQGAVGVWTAPVAAADRSRQDFLSGVAVGAGLVLVGVCAGAALGRRR